MYKDLIAEKELVELQGSLTSYNSSAVQEDLEMVLNDTLTLSLDVTNLEQLDVVGIFMLSTLKDKACSDGKTIQIINHDNKIVTLAIKLSGMLNVIDVV